MVVMLVKANKTNSSYQFTTSPLIFYIVMFKKENLYLKCVFYFTISSAVGMGGLGREGLFTVATDGNLQKYSICPL